MAFKIGIHWKLKFYVLFQCVLDNFHHQDFTTILQSHRCYCPNLQLVKLCLRQQILPCLTQEGAELGLELRSDLPPKSLISLLCILFQAKGPSSPSRQHLWVQHFWVQHCWVPTEESALFHVNVSINLLFNELHFKHFVFRKCNFKFLWVSLVSQLVKKLPANAEDTKEVGSIPGSGRSPGEGNGNPLQDSCLENPIDSRAWRATVHGVAKSWAQLSMPAQEPAFAKTYEGHVMFEGTAKGRLIYPFL